MAVTVRTIAATGLAVGALALTRRMTMTWGTETENEQNLPGDDLIDDPALVATRAVGINAPAHAVWPWIAQIGQGRAGFYSYDVLENMLGLEIHSADRITDHWQDLALGDKVKLSPTGPGLDVVLLDRDQHLVIQGLAADVAVPVPFDFTWAFVLARRENGTTRLVVRERYRPCAWWAYAVIEAVQPLSFVMTQKMLRGIRDRAETAWLARP